jgi:protein phosphatase
MLRLLSAGATDVGLLRRNNEDAYLLMPEAGVFALSDGMGGEAAGEVANQYFIEAAQAAFGNKVPAFEEASCALIEKAFRCSNKRILEHTAQNPNDSGMGCTGDLLVFYGRNYVIGHVGDSKVYLLRDRSLRQLTKDHSLVQQLVDQGMLTPKQAKNHPRKNIILRAVGTDPLLSFDIIKGEGFNHDIFLLCSDGLTDMLDDSAIQDILASTGSLQYKVENLIRSALAAGGRDNITVVLCEVGIERQ